jgi:hypothetical protein
MIHDRLRPANVIPSEGHGLIYISRAPNPYTRLQDKLDELIESAGPVPS